MFRRGILSDVLKDQVLRQGKPPMAAFRHLDRDNPTRALRFSFGLAQPSGIRSL
jgi:hypothetical protein